MRWLIERLAQQKTHSVTRLVRKLDDALNNTSLILLMRGRRAEPAVPRRRPDRELEYTLDRLPHEPELRAKLAGIDLYKVGHHGSRNATPRSLHALWVDRPTRCPA